jgi:tRNA-modifying protein YgfZ
VVTSVLLEDRAVIVVSGEEAGAFLDRILTNNVSDLREGEGRYAALLTPQGKVIADMVVGCAAPQILMLIVPAAVCAELQKRLMMFRLRSRVALTILSDAEPMSADVDLTVFEQWRLVVSRSGGVSVSEASRDAYHSHRIALGIPHGGLDFAYGDVFPHEINMDRLNGIDFAKGCYVGQEIVSRMQHRGTARTRIMKIAYMGGFGPEAGADMTAGGKVIGSAGFSIAGHGLAMIRLDKLADALAAGETIVAGGIAATISAPPYAPDFMPEVS